MATLASQLSTSKYFVDLFDNWISSFCKNKILSDCSLVFNQSIVNMAKNTSSSAFRKIDIDQYNEDNFKDDEAEQAVPTGPDEGEVSALLNQGRYVEALQLVLSNAPLGSSNQQVKDNALALTLKVLLAIKSAQIEEAVGNLSRDDIDVLMKYIYRGFEYPSEGSSGHLLLWHEKAYNIGGSGSIVRVLSDRMKV